MPETKQRVARTRSRDADHRSGSQAIRAFRRERVACVALFCFLFLASAAQPSLPGDKIEDPCTSPENWETLALCPEMTAALAEAGREQDFGELYEENLAADIILGDWPASDVDWTWYVEPIEPSDFARFIGPPLVNTPGGDLFVRAWNFMPSVPGYEIPIGVR